MWNPFRPRPCRLCHALAARVEDLELDVATLQGALHKLRGRLTGGMRKERTDPNGEGDSSQLELDPVSAAILARRSRVRRQLAAPEDPGD